MTKVVESQPSNRSQKAVPTSRFGQLFKQRLYPLYCAITGRGGEFLKHKQEVHRRRGIAERQVLEEAKLNPSLFRENVCPSCGERSQPREEFANPIGFKFAVCPLDGTIYMDPIPTDETLTRMYNDPAESYLWLRDQEPGNVEVAATDNEEYHSLRRWIPERSERLRLLDVGCATGSFLLTARQSFDVEGCELNDSTAATARAHGLKVRTGSIQQFPGDGVFDVITMLQVIEHLPTPADSLREVWRLLKPGGYFFASTPNIDSASFEYLRERHIHVSSFGHVSLFNRKSLLSLGQRSGFEFVNHEFCSGSDLSLHDWFSYRFARNRFSHRMALYNARLWFGSRVLERITLGIPQLLIFPRGNDSYQRVLFRKPLRNPARD